MVNNNGILPIEVKKPVEMVQELKNEIPSFEEFMKTYEADGNLNYADLNGGDIGTQKGHGPCNYSNADCTCYAGQGWIQLYVGCLADGCPNRNSAFSWVHAACSKPIYISTELQLKCISCNSPSHMRNWSFNCHDSRHPGDYIKTSINSFTNALSLIGNDIRNRHPDVRSKMRTITIKLMDEQGW